MEKVSIIIPNYNCEKHILSCLNSVVDQNYKEKEIIIVDDGSTDSSIKLINEFINNNINYDIKLICQNNLNAAIARNEGIKMATGKYLFFLDSDDIIEKGIISKLLKEATISNADLIIGNYEIIDEKSRHIRNAIFFDKRKIYETEEDILLKLSPISPVPSNKLYSKEIIDKHNLSWGNVRIGQDLNFYLKYLSVCKKVLTINEKIYKYRIVEKSISRTYDFKIFDIVNSFNDVKQYYKKNNKIDIYDKYLQVLELKNYNSQIWKQRNFKTKKERNIVVDYFAISERKIDYSRCVNFNKNYQKIYLKFKFKVYFKTFYTSSLLMYVKKIIKRQVKM